MTMGLTYFKRYRMAFDFSNAIFEPPPLPDGYELHPWEDQRMEAHAEVKFRSFCFEIDANVFPCLGNREGCAKLMREISRRETFLPPATWLLEFKLPHMDEPDFCGTIQGLHDRRGFGAVQNLGVTPEHRGKGLGTHLLHHALLGFRSVGLPQAVLEVTAQNSGALRLYERLGFSRIRTVYKAVEVAYA